LPLLSSPAAPWGIAAEYRPDLTVRERLEFWNGYNKKAYGDQAVNPGGNRQGRASDRFVLQRIVAGLTCRGDTVQWRVAAYDARAWGTSLGVDDFVKNRGTGQEHVMAPYWEYLEPYELYIGLGKETGGSRLVLGRQIIGFGDNRIFGPGAVTNSIGWLWDAARYQYRAESWSLDGWYGQTKTQDPDSPSLLREYAYQGVGVYGQWRHNVLGSVEPFYAWKQGLFFNNGSRESVSYLGCRVVRDGGPGLVYDITLAMEWGEYEEQEGATGRVEAAAYACKIGWSFAGQLPLSPVILIGQDYASGDPEPDNGPRTTFSRPFGTTDGEHYGVMDLMNWSNMRDTMLDVRLAPAEKVSLRLVWHDFRLDQAADKWGYFGYRVQENRYDRIGQEFDLILKVKPVQWLSVMAFYGHFRAGDFIRRNAIAENDADRAVLQLTFSW